MECVISSLNLPSIPVFNTGFLCKSLWLGEPQGHSKVSERLAWWSQLIVTMCYTRMKPASLVYNQISDISPWYWKCEISLHIVICKTIFYMSNVIYCFKIIIWIALSKYILNNELKRFMTSSVDFARQLTFHSEWIFLQDNLPCVPLWILGLTDLHTCSFHRHQSIMYYK